MVKLYLELYDEHKARLLHELLDRLLRDGRVRMRELRHRRGVDHKWLYKRLGPYLEKLGVVRRVYERG